MEKDRIRCTILVYVHLEAQCPGSDILLVASFACES